jgi:hypothetical protein
MNNINPYAPLGVNDSHASYRTPKAGKSGVLDLPTDKVSNFYLLRESNSIQKSKKH